LVPGSLFTGSSPFTSSPPKLGSFGSGTGGGTTTDVPKVYLSGSCPARVEYQQTIVTDRTMYAIQFLIKASDLAITLVDVQYSLGAATIPVVAHLTSQSSTLWVLRSVTIGDTQTMTYYFTFGSPSWSCTTAIFTFAPSQVDTSSSNGLPTPGNSGPLNGGFPINVPNDLPFPSTSGRPTIGDVMGSTDMSGCVNVQCYESCLSSSLTSTGMTSCINNCVSNCALADQGITAAVNSMRMMRLMKSMRTLSGQSSLGPSFSSKISRRLLQSDLTQTNETVPSSSASTSSESDSSGNTTEYGSEPSSTTVSESGSENTVLPPPSSSSSGVDVSSSSDTNNSETAVGSGGSTSVNCSESGNCTGTWWSPEAE
jgi:hypothetical protein